MKEGEEVEKNEEDKKKLEWRNEFCCSKDKIHLSGSQSMHTHMKNLYMFSLSYSGMMKDSFQGDNIETNQQMQIFNGWQN